MTSSNIFGKTVLLVIVLALIGFLYVQTIEPELETMQVDASSFVGSNQVLLEVSHEVEKPSSYQIVTDKFTQEIDKDGVVVVVDGSNAYAVRKGAVIVDGNVIKVSEEEYSVDFTGDSRRVVSSE